MSELLLQGGRVIDKSGERLADVLVDSEGRIAEVGEGLKGRETLDVRGKSYLLWFCRPKCLYRRARGPALRNNYFRS